LQIINSLERGAVLLACDETDILLFPPLRAVWKLRGKPALVHLSGKNDKCVLFGAINIRTGHRLLLARRYLRWPDFVEFLIHLRVHYRDQPIALLLDSHPAHISPHSLKEAHRLKIRLVWLPYRSGQLNPMDHLWKEVKRTISSNHQYDSLEQHVDTVALYLYSLSLANARLKAGLLSPDFWLRPIL
jgi:hypothetical protein